MPPRDDDRRTIDSAEATLARDIERTWRNWKAFAAEKIDELAAQQADELPESDLTGEGRPAPRKARLDAATRQQFGAVLEARRQQAQAKGEREAREQGRPAPDADQIYAGLLKHLAAELDGAIHPSGMALLWYKDALIKFDAAALGAGTTDADYLAMGAGKGPTKQQAALLLGLIAAMSVIAAFMVRWAFGEPPADPGQAAMPARVGQATAALWAVERAAIGDQAMLARMIGAYPPVLCVEAPAARLVRPGATVVLTGTQAIRRYQIQAAASTADLLLADCAASPPIPQGAAQLVETRTRIMLAAETLRSLVVRGPDLDPQAIPANQMEVAIDVAVPEAGGGTLILADGQRWSATRSAPAGGGTRLVYLVPLAQAAQPAGWELTGRADLPELLPIDLPAPTSRATILRRVLDVRAGQPNIAMRDGAPELSISLALTLVADAGPLALLTDDLVVLSNGMPAMAHWDAPQLVPGQSTPITVRIPLHSQDTIELALASWRVRINTH